MFVDASALVAILAHEQEAGDLLARMEHAPQRLTSPLAVWEAAIAVGRQRKLLPLDALKEITDFLTLLGVTIQSIDQPICDSAVDAYQRFGKGRHPAGLNFGDCFAYACARHLSVPMLYKGDDFSMTDIDSA